MVSLNNLESDAKRMFVLVPVGAEHFEAADLLSGTYMLADARAYIVVAYAYQSDGITGIVGQSVELDFVRQ